MQRLSLILLPFLAAFALMFGLFYMYAGYRVLQSGRAGPGALLIMFGAMGVGLAVGIWVARRRVRAKAPDAPTGRPAA